MNHAHIPSTVCVCFFNCLLEYTVNDTTCLLTISKTANRVLIVIVIILAMRRSPSATQAPTEETQLFGGNAGHMT